MAESRIGIALQILRLLAEVNFPGLTRGEIRNRLGLPADTEITARIRELRDKAIYGNFDIRVEHIASKEFAYYLLGPERTRAKNFLAVRRSA